MYDDPAMSQPARDEHKHRPTGLRNLRELDLPEERIEITDPARESAVPAWGTEDSCKLIGGAVAILRQ